MNSLRRLFVPLLSTKSELLTHIYSDVLWIGYLEGNQTFPCSFHSNERETFF